MKNFILLICIILSTITNAQIIRSYNVDTSVYPVKIYLELLADDTNSINRIKETNTGDSLNTYSIDVIFKGCAVRGGLNYVDTNLYLFEKERFALKLTTVLDTFYECGFPKPDGEPIRVDSFYVNYNTAVSVTEIDNQLKVYPNPSSQYLFVKGLDASANYQILDATGKVISIQKDSSEKINIEKLNPGLYYLNIIRQGKNDDVLEFIKE